MSDDRTLLERAASTPAEQIEIMRHALGIRRGQREYRNHFCTGPGSDDYANCEALVAAGCMSKRKGSALSGGDDIYHVTATGRAIVRAAAAMGGWQG